MKREKPQDKYPRQAEYTGHKVYDVFHPDHGGCTVIARNSYGAIVTAASVWGERWQRYGFYAYCETAEQKREASKHGKRNAAD